MAHNFNHQTNITLGESIKMGVKAPALEDRIFDTWSDANTYIHDENSSAVNGLVLTVINDGENNGGWFVNKRQTNNNQYELTLTRIGTGGGGSCDLLIPITYNALKNFRDTNQLVPGCRYRIIDYVTKANVDMYNMDWSQIDPSQLQYLSFSAEHPYDIIVLATDVNKLSEDARAIQHEGDTYFSGSNLEAWELKYSLDNDTQYSWIQDPFNYGESILPPFQFCYMSTKEGGQNPDFQNLLWEDSYVYDNYNLCDNVPQWLQQQIEQYVNVSQQYGQDISIEIGDTYYVPYPDDTSYGMVRVACWGLGDQVVYFNRITVLRITINENVVVEFPVVYDYDNPNVWHLEEGDMSMDIGVTFGTEWEIMVKGGKWQKVVVKNTGKIIVEVHGCKGVVFEMKDEYNNKADYDFKNIIYATEYDTDGVYSFDLYIDSNNLMSIVIPDSIDNPTQVVDTYSDVTVNCVYDDWEGWHIPYYNEQQCFVSHNNYLFNYLWYDSNYINVNYIGYNNNGFIDTSIGCPEEIRKKMIELIKTYASVTQYLLELYLDYTFSKNYNDEMPISNNDGDSDKKSGKVKRTYKKLLSNVPVKEYKTIDGDKIKNYLENVSEKHTKGKKRVDELRNRLSVLNRIEDIRKASVGDKKFTFENNLKSVLFNSRKSTNVRAGSNSSPVSAWSSMDASLNVYDWETSSGSIQPIAVAENEVHGYVVNYAESQEEYSQIGCRTLPMIVMHAYPDSNFNNKSSITFNKVSCDGYYGVTYIDCYWFEGNKLFFPDFQYNYMYAASYNAIYNYWDEIASQIMGYPGQYGDKYWQQGDYRALNHRPDANITFEDSDGNELGSFNIGDDQQDDETIVIPTGGGMSTLTWRTPTKDEWSYLCLYRSASKVYDSTLGDYVSNARYINTQINGINGLVLLPDVFELPSGITMSNINVNGSQYIGNIYTVSQWEELEGAGCVFIPCGGYRWEENIDYSNVRGYYWSSTNGGESETFDAWGMELGNGYASLNYMPLGNGNSVRLIKDEQSGNFTISEHDNKCNIAKSNLQFHCKNKEWRFAENAYDIIGSDNTNIAENYDGWIDLFGYGTSGWNSGFNAYQPWSTSDNYIDYISYDLTGEYANADWGIYNMSYDSLATVAYTGDYNDLVNKPTIPNAQVQSDWLQTDTTAPDYIKNKPTINPDWFGTQAEFEALTEYDETTNYHIETNPPSALPFKTYDKLIKWIKPEPFYFEDRTGNINSVTVQIGSTPINYEYSTDNTTWTSQATEANQSYGIIIPPNGKVYLRATANTWYESKLSTTDFSNVGGNIMSLLYGVNFDGQTSFPNASSIFDHLFAGATKIIESHKLLLPATTLVGNCYLRMFTGCTNLTTAPDLPATTLASRCYQYMFEQCGNLITAPDLPATTLVSRCYYGMFYSASTLNSIKCLATNIPTTDCTENMMFGVAANGTFTKDANMNDWTTGVNGIPSGWTVVNV